MKKLFFSSLALLASVLGASVAYLGLCTGSLPLSPTPRRDGAFIAEVWLDWEVTRGSTMYRQTFESELAAQFFAKFYAAALDTILPRGWPTQDWLGRPFFDAYKFSIKCGVRSLAPSEAESGVVAFFCNHMPSTGLSRSEHFFSHPMFAKADDGFKA